MLLGALAELMTLGAVLPFLAIMADPGKALDYPLLGRALGMLGLSAPSDLLLPATIVFATIALCAGGLRLLLVWSSQKFVYRLGYDLGVEVYRRTLYQPYSYHATKNTSELIAGINKVQMIIAGMLLPLMQALTGALISLFILAALILIDTTTALVAAAGFGGIYAAVSTATRRRLRANSGIIASTQSRRVQAIQEGLGGIRDVLLDHAQPIYVRRFAHLDSQFRDAQAWNAFIGIAPRFVIEALGMVLIAALAFGLSRQTGGLLAVLPTLGALALGAQRMLPLLQQVYNGWAQAVGSHHLLADVLQLLELPVKAVDSAARSGKPQPFTRAIRFKSVSFRYAPHQQLVLENVDLTIHKGDRIGIIGKTGSGKSTLADLMMGLLRPTSGEIWIDDKLLDESSLPSWQAQIAHVPQSIYLADATIAENIAFAVPDHCIDLDRVTEAARKARLHDFIMTLPGGYRTVVGERGVRLSGGQRQRIGIARALYKEAQILVFDEATSALDSETETAVMEAIQSLGTDLTIVLIAHRLSTLRSCNRVFQVSRGRVLEIASPLHADLISALRSDEAKVTS